jgi:hypothetical protein
MPHESEHRGRHRDEVSHPSASSINSVEEIHAADDVPLFSLEPDSRGANRTRSTEFVITLTLSRRPRAARHR